MMIFEGGGGGGGGGRGGGMSTTFVNEGRHPPRPREGLCPHPT